MAAALGVAAYQLLLPPQERLNLMTNSADTRQMPSESGI
nr:transcriptional regulator [Neisseria meningitidis alpha153]